MENKFRLVLNKTLHDMAILDLRLQNSSDIPCEMTYNDVMYIDIITAHPGKYTASNIADMLFVSRPAVTQKINELERKGYIYKKQSETDKRAFYLYINKKGEYKEYYNSLKKIDDIVYKKLKEEFSKEKMNMFFEVSNRISELMNQESEMGE